MGVTNIFKNGKMGSGIKFGTVLGVGFNTAVSISDYKDAREQGHSRLGSAAKAATSFAVGEVLGGWMLPATLLPMVPQAAVGAIEGIGKMQRQMNYDSRRVPFNNATFNDYSQAFTMRQAGMQLAQNSQYNLQQSLMGNEAAYLYK